MRANEPGKPYPWRVKVPYAGYGTSARAERMEWVRKNLPGDRRRLRCIPSRSYTRPDEIDWSLIDSNGAETWSFLSEEDALLFEMIYGE